MSDIAEELRKQEEELMRIRKKRERRFDTEPVRKFLNVAFMIVALIGLVLYFLLPESRTTGLCVMAVGMVFKIVELFLRFML